MGMLFLAVHLVRQQPVGRRCSFDSCVGQTAPCTEYKHNKCPIRSLFSLISYAKGNRNLYTLSICIKKGQKRSNWLWSTMKECSQSAGACLPWVWLIVLAKWTPLTITSWYWARDTLRKNEVRTWPINHASALNTAQLCDGLFSFLFSFFLHLYKVVIAQLWLPNALIRESPESEKLP